MRIGFAHHLSLSYPGGGEKWLIQLAEELRQRGHEIIISSLPFTLGGQRGPTPVFEGIEYKEGYRHKIRDVDVTYVTYNPLSWLNFDIEGPKIAGLHSACYWNPVAWEYGLLPNLANIVHKFLSDLWRYDAVHSITNAYLVKHPNVHVIPNFVDTDTFRPTIDKAEDFTIGYASRKVWQKGYDIFLELTELMEDVKFIATQNIPEPAMPDFFSSKHGIVVPSRVGTYDLALVEGLACGTPSISSGIPAHRALKVPLRIATTIDEYIREIEGLRQHYEEGMDEIVRECRKSALQYDKKAVITRLENLFEEVAS